MKNSTAAILEEAQRERERRAALTRQDLERSYHALQESGYDLGLCISFAADLAGSRQIEYHYELVVEDWKRARTKQLDLEHGFAKRRKEGRDFLFPRLDAGDAFESVHAASLIAQSFYSWDQSEVPEREKLAPYLIRYAGLPSPELRQIAIIAMGWVYAPCHFQAELECLCTHLVSDEDVLCRAWSASAFMQIFFHDAPVEPIRERSLPAFRQSLQQEIDDFALGVAIESMKELWGWNIRLSQAAVERRDHEAIEKARKRALKLVNQL
ncbi:hypothetical protein SAMN02910435_01267 [Ruminococcaceae bacterium D5]|nr:hypothetical protein SAMN02910435_01267 [Ruminococcaceae bacterium D5]